MDRAILTRNIAVASVRAEPRFSPIRREADYPKREKGFVEIGLDFPQRPTKAVRVFCEPCASFIINDLDKIAYPNALLTRRYRAVLHPCRLRLRAQFVQ